MAIGRQHEVRFLTKIYKQNEFLKMKEDLVREQNRDNKLNERRMLCDHSRSDCMRKSERGTLKLWSFLDGNDQRQGRARSDMYEGLGVLFR
jgi:hypothetical protein